MRKLGGARVVLLPMIYYDMKYQLCPLVLQHVLLRILHKLKAAVIYM